MTTQELTEPTFRASMPPGRPRWARPCLAAVLALAAFLYTWGLSRNGYANQFYAAAVLSGTESWKAFFYGSLDSASFITVDKPPLAFWIIELPARLFGFNSWTLLLPQALEGIATVAVVHAAVRRGVRRFLGVRGAYAAGLLAALVLALTPITVAIDRDSNPDPALTLLLVLGAWAFGEAVASGRPRYLVLSGAAFGLGFDAKMLQAFIALPVLALVYLAVGRGGVWHRLGGLCAAGAALLATALPWMVIVDLVPRASRPYVGSSTDDTVWNLTIGYNGLGRVFGRDHRFGPGMAGHGPRWIDLPGMDRLSRHGFGAFGGRAGAGRLFGPMLGGQISWLIPLAVVAAVTLLIMLRGRPRTDPARAAVLMWAGWLALHAVVFSLSQGGFHPYYTTVMAPSIAALCGIGVVAMARHPRVLLVAVAMTGGWAVVLLRRTPDWNAWLAWVVLGLTVVAMLGVAVWGRLEAMAASVRDATGPDDSVSAAWGRLARAAALATATVAALGCLAGPAAYAVTPLAHPALGNNPLAGPDAAGGGMPEILRGALDRTVLGRRAKPDPRLVSYLRTHRDGATYLVAVTSAMTAAPIMLATHGIPVMAMGGFMGADPAPTLAQFRADVAAGRLRYVLVDAGGLMDRGPALTIAPWVRAHCAAVPASDYGAGPVPAGPLGTQTLYRCG